MSAPLSPRDREVFETDGSLRDIYVMGTDIPAWQLMLEHVVATYPTEFNRGNDVSATPPPADEIFAGRGPDSRVMTLKIDVHGLAVHTHFFQEDEIEFDIDPHEFRSQIDVDRILAFMTELGDLLDRDVILTPENWPLAPLYRYRPGEGPPECLWPRSGPEG